MRRLGLVVLFLAGCASTGTRSSVLKTVDDVRVSPAARDAEQRAPQAFAHAESLRERAEQAERAGDATSARILGEHALAAYERAVVLARLAVAEARRGTVEAQLRAAELELGALDEQQRRVLSETENLELRARVLRDALPLPSNVKASPERERARLEAARALALQARLLCASARLLDPDRGSLGPLDRELDALEARLANPDGKLAVPLDEATRLRSRCLSELSAVRRPKTLAAPAASSSDQLLEELSNATYSPVRDDRGIVVTLRDVFETSPTPARPPNKAALGAETKTAPVTPNASVTAAAAEKLTALGRVAAAHPDFPVLVVLHSAQPTGTERDEARLAAAVGALRTGGATRIGSALGGNRAPTVNPKRPGATSRNERLEIVFVAPTST